MTNSMLSICKLCLFKSEPLDEICMEEAHQLKQIIEELFHHVVYLSRMEVDGICMPCRSKLKSYHEYYKFVLENQKTYENQIKMTYESSLLIGEVESEKPEFIEIIKEELPDPYSDDDGHDEHFEMEEPKVLISQREEKIEPPMKIENAKTEIKDIEDPRFPDFSDEELINFDGKKSKVKKKCDPDYNPKLDKKQLKEDDAVPKCFSNRKTNFHKGNRTKKRNRPSRARPETLEKYKKWDEQILTMFDFICIRCPDKKNFESYDELQKHSISKHLHPKKWICCEKKMTTRGDLLAHIRGHTESPRWVCKDCGAVFPDGRKYRTHWSKNHRKCDLCNLSALKKETYFHHMQRHVLSTVPGKLARYTCDLCKKTTINRVGMKKHMENIHVIKYRYMCENCGSNWVSKSALANHIKNVHSKAEVTKLPCTICGVLIRDRQGAMESHVRNNHEAQPVACDICGETLKHALALKKHIVRRHGEKRHSCTFCEKTFCDKRRLKDHVAIHTGKPNYFCEFCTGASFKSLGNYMAHKRRLHPIEYGQQKAANQAKKYQ